MKAETLTKTIKKRGIKMSHIARELGIHKVNLCQALNGTRINKRTEEILKLVERYLKVK